MSHDADIYIAWEKEPMTNSSELTTDTLPETIDLHDHPKTTVENLSEVVVAQAGENRQLKAENRILWDLLLFDLSEVTTYEPDDSSRLVAGVRAPHQNGA
jgi:hypothetical protein